MIANDFRFLSKPVLSADFTHDGERVNIAVVIRERSQCEDEAVRRPKLTTRELALLQMAANGESCRSSASLLNLSLTYVKHLRHRAMIKLGADSAAHAVALTLRQGLIR